jgi:putative nucleotidyltransferase with HDIG domain
MDPRKVNPPTKIAIVSVAWLVYLLLFSVMFEAYGLRADAFSFLPIIAAAWFGGMGWGLLATFVLWSINTIVWAAFGVVASSDFLLAATGNATLPVIALTVGALSETRINLLNEYEERKSAEEKLAVLAAQLEIKVADRTAELRSANLKIINTYDQTLRGWGLAVAARDHETGDHSERVVALSMALAAAVGLKKSEVDQIRRGAYLHDIGKIGIPDSILLKEGPLSHEEMAVMRTHPQLGYDMLSGIDYLGDALDIPRYHHERWDGTGYPSGLSGEDIPLAARIFAIVDVWDALRSDRPYRKAWTKQKTIDYIQEQRGAHFDPQLVDVFIDLQRNSD